MQGTNCVLVLGAPGSGKSTSIGAVPELGLKGLDPKTTYVIACTDNKTLPWRGSANQYKQSGVTFNDVNFSRKTNAADVIAILQKIAAERPEIKNIILDDFQYLMSGEFFSRIKEKGWDKFDDIALGAWSVIKQMQNMGNRNTAILSHSEWDDKANRFKIKTIGKVLDEKAALDGKFDVILYCTEKVIETGVTKVFVTNHDGMHPARSPHGMFTEMVDDKLVQAKHIPNDLSIVFDKMTEYALG